MDENKIYYIYAYIRLDTNTYFYIGKGKNNRWKRSDNRSKYFLNILNSTDCVVEILYDNLTESDAFLKEMEIIEDLVLNEGYSIYIPEFYEKDNEKQLVNKTWGGEGTTGYHIKQSQETINKRVEKNTG